jgi:AraC-like DNA-binding protein
MRRRFVISCQDGRMTGRHEPGIHPLYLRLLAGPLRRHGVEPAALFASCGLSLAALESDETPVPVSRVRALVPEAVRRSGSPWLGLDLGAEIQVFSHGPLGIAVAASGSVHQALEVACRFVGLRAPVFSFSVRPSGGGVRLTVEENADLGPSRQFVLEALLVMLERLLQALSARDFGAARYGLPWPEPAWSRHYRSYLAGAWRFGTRRLELFLPQALADAPCLSADPEAFAFARAECERRLALGGRERDLLAQVRRILWQGDGGPPDARALARRIGVSTRSLHRALARAGSGYRMLVDEMRRERACRWLGETELPVGAIAERLGYADPSNFSRCFRRWCGLTPREYRLRSRAARPSR